MFFSAQPNKKKLSHPTESISVYIEIVQIFFLPQNTFPATNKKSRILQQKGMIYSVEWLGWEPSTKLGP